MLFLFTDGLTEAENVEHELFKLERVKETAAQALACHSQAPRPLISIMTQAVHQFVGEAEQSDDLTMMGIQFRPGQGQPH